MKNNIILRDCPKKMIQIDLWAFNIGGGFRGFQNVANGLHYIAVIFQGKYSGMWCYVDEETLVKAFDWDEASFYDLEESDKKTFQEMADSGVMNDKLIEFPDVAAEQWQILSSYITKDFYQNYEFQLPMIDTNIDGAEVLAAYQLAFLKVIVQHSDNLAKNDMDNWKKWLRVFYDADTTVIKSQPNLFSVFIDLLTLHLTLIPETYKTNIDFVFKERVDFINKIEKTEIVDLIEKGRVFKIFKE
jgi:hypothetical protein